MGQSLTNFDAMLKEFYPRDVIMDLVKQKAPFYFELTIPYKYVYGRIDISGPVMKQTRTSQGAFDDVMEQEVEGCIKDGARDLSRQLFGFGNGQLCVLTGTGASATQACANGQGVADNDDIPARFLAANMIVAGITPSNGAWEFVRTVSSVN